MQKQLGWVQDNFGNAVGNAQIDVYLGGQGTHATIYTDNNFSPLANPFLSDPNDGGYFFFAPNGIYDLVFTKPGLLFNPLDTQSIILFDQRDVLKVGVGSPQGVVIANPGTLYLNTNGGAGTTLWVKESGVGTNTGWVSK